MARDITATIEIEAPPERVWAVVTDFARYGVWNAFIPGLRAEGALRVGTRLEETVQPPGEREVNFRPTITVWDPPRELRWVAKVGGVLFVGEHQIRCEPLPGGRTRFVQRERISGLLPPLMGRQIANTERGYADMNRAVKERVEMGR